MLDKSLPVSDCCCSNPITQTTYLDDDTDQTMDSRCRRNTQHSTEYGSIKETQYNEGDGNTR